MTTFLMSQYGSQLLLADTSDGELICLWHEDVFPEDLIPDGKPEYIIGIESVGPEEYDPSNIRHYFLKKDRRDMFIRHVYQACPGANYREHFCTSIHVDDLPDVENLQFIALEAAE